MAILNYTTQVNADKTIGEIYSILARAGANEIAYEQNNGQVAAVRFTLIHADAPLTFRIAPNPEGVLKSMIRDKVTPKYRTATQAHRVAWRILKDAIEAQMAIFNSQQGEIAEVFLPYAIDGHGESFYKAFTNLRIKALTAGSSPVNMDDLTKAFEEMMKRDYNVEFIDVTPTSPMTLEQTIDALPDGKELHTYDPPSVVDEQSGKSGHWPTDLTTDDLKRLVRENREMREAIGNYIKARRLSCGHDHECTCPYETYNRLAEIVE